MSKPSSEFVAEYRGIAESSDTLIKADDQTLYREMCWECHRVVRFHAGQVKGDRYYGH
jgi:hypothetical protein